MLRWIRRWVRLAMGEFPVAGQKWTMDAAGEVQITRSLRRKSYEAIGYLHGGTEYVAPVSHFVCQADPVLK